MNIDLTKKIKNIQTAKYQKHKALLPDGGFSLKIKNHLADTTLTQGFIVEDGIDIIDGKEYEFVVVKMYKGEAL